MNFVALWPLAALFGALIGSFLNVVIWRVPRGESLTYPSSHCPRCDHPIRGYDNIPVISWLALRGKCRDCKAPISPRYPTIELLGAVSFAGVFVWWALSNPVSLPVPFVIVVVAYLYLASVSIALAMIDIDVHRLPNSIVLPSYIVVVVLLSAASLVEHDPGAILRAVIGGAGLFVLYLVLAIAWPGGMGFGDVKLAGVLGFSLAWLGWGALAVGAFTPFLLGGVFGIALVVIRRAGRKTRIPFGPWMLGGAWIGLIAGDSLAMGYLSLFGLA